MAAPLALGKVELKTTADGSNDKETFLAASRATNGRCSDRLKSLWDKFVSNSQGFLLKTSESIGTLEEGRMYKWSCGDPYGNSAFQNDEKSVLTNSRPLDEQELNQILKKLAPLVDAVSQHINGQSTQRTDVRHLVGRLYNQLHDMHHVRKWSAQIRRVDPSTEDVTPFLTPFTSRLCYWARPAGIFAACFALQSILLHYCTYYYIKRMDMVRSLVTGNTADAEEVRSGKLYDIVDDALGKQRSIPTALLDLTGIVPMLMFVGSYCVVAYKGHCNVGLWTKTFLIASVMAVLKGTCDFMTVLPDSSGFESCERRLGADIDKFRDLEFGAYWLEDMIKMFWLEIAGGDNGRVRYCADMLVSGHTYFATLFSLSSYRMVKYVTKSKGRRWIRYTVGCTSAICVAVEVSLVAAAEFHYSVDMYIAIILVFLLWQSAFLDTVASIWTEGYYWRDPQWKRPSFLSALRGRSGTKGTYQIVNSKCRKLIDRQMLRRMLFHDPEIDSSDEDEMAGTVILDSE